MTAPQPGLMARLGPAGIAAAVTVVLILFGVGSIIVPWLTDGGGTPKAASAAPEPVVPAADDQSTSMPSPAAPSTAQTTAKASPTTVAGNFNSGYEDRVVQLINGERRKKKCEAVRVSPQLRSAARSHSADMAARDFVDDKGSDGTSPQDRVSRAGYSGGFAGELVAKGGDAGDVVKDWVRDDDDRDKLLDCATKSIGVGAAMRGRTPYWTVDTGRA